MSKQWEMMFISTCISESISFFPISNLFIVFITGRHLGFFSAAHAHQLMHAWLAKCTACNAFAVHFAHQPMRMCGARGNQYCDGYENDE
jgi:hypothetical protein